MRGSPARSPRDPAAARSADGPRIRDFLARVRQDVSPGQSIVLRYAQWLAPLVEQTAGVELDPAGLEAVSLGEGAMVRPLLEHGGVRIALLDETTAMASRTFKSVEACLTAAICRALQVQTVVSETGGNTGSALALYAGHAGIRSWLVVPERNLGLLSVACSQPLVRVIAVAPPAHVKTIAPEVARRTGGRRVPELAWRYVAGMFRGCRILERLLQSPVDWLSQTISAAFGPIGIYRLLRLFAGELGPLPRFLGVQQQENAPYYRRLQQPGQAPAPAPASSALLIPTMYDSDPFTYGAFDEFRDDIVEGGGLVTIGRAELERYVTGPYRGEDLLTLMRRSGVALPAAGIEDVTGLVGLAGVIKAIDEGLIAPGASVLHALTAGAGARHAATVQPHLVVASDDQLAGLAP